jgi:hypothetical protein
MALPKAVQREVDAANKIADEMKAAQQPNPEDRPPEATAPEAKPPAAPTKDIAPPSDDSGWEHRYKVLQGKYNAEVPRLQADNRDLLARLSGLENMLASLNAQQRPAADQGAPSQPAGEKYRYVKDEERHEFGEDLYDFIKRAAREAVEPVVDQRFQEVSSKLGKTEKTVNSVASSVVQSARDKLHATLDDQVPQWSQLNTDDGFIAWLDQDDPYSGVRRGTLLTQAYNANNAPRVVAIFKGFLNEHAAVSAPGTPAPSNASQATGGPQVNLDTLVAPGAPSAGAAGAPNEANKRIWTHADIAAFYRDVQLGKFRNNLPRQRELEHDIFAAQRENRIR